MALLQRVFKFYRDGFRSMVLGRTLWKIIIIKLVVMFGVLKLFFFPNYLQTNFTNDQDRADHVLDVITRPASIEEGLENEDFAALQESGPYVLKSKNTRR